MSTINLKMNPNLLIFSLTLLLFLTFLSPTTPQKLKEIKIGNSTSGRLEIDESHTYFFVKIPENYNKKILIINTHENIEKKLESDETFSDPDFYISKINKYPSSLRSSEWFSERYGSDILAIPPKSINPGDIFYIGMYCQFKCRYYLHIYFAKELSLELGTMVDFQIKPHETMNYKLHIDKEFEELNVIANAKDGGKFRMFMNKEAPSSQNTFNVVPSWINGYSIQVSNTNKKQYCTDCDYHILIQNEGDQEINSLTLYAYIQDKIFTLDPVNILYDAMDKLSRRCYKFDMTAEEKEKEKLIIQFTKYSGILYLVINGWNKEIEEDLKSVKNQGKYHYLIVSELFLILNQTDFSYFDKETPGYKDKDSSLYFCVYSDAESSFTVSTYYLTQIEEAYNILTPNNKVRSYLLKNQVMKYNLLGTNIDKVQYEIKSNLTVSITKVVGEIDTFGYYCKEEYCLSDKKKIKELDQKLVIKSTNDNFETQSIDIRSKENMCYKEPIITLSNKNKLRCGIMALVKCVEPNEEGICVYDIQLTVKDTPLLMNPNQMYYGEIPLGKEDYYDIVITDPEIHSIVVVLNSESGDAELLFYIKKVEMENDKNNVRLVSVSFHNDYIPDVIRITPARLRKENLVGHYLVKVTATTFSTYSLYYYVTYNKKKDEKEILPEVTMDIQIGYIITDYFPNDIRYKIYSFTPLLNEKKSIKIFIDKVNEDFNIYIYKNVNTFKILPFYEVKHRPNAEEITGYDWKNEGSNQVTISKSDPKFQANQMYYIIIAPKKHKYSLMDLHENLQNRDIRNETEHEEINEKSAIQFYLGVTEEESKLTITEGMPHSMTLNEQYPGQSYYYQHSNINSDFNLDIDVLMGEIDIFIDLKEIDLEAIEKLKSETSELKSEGSMLYKLNIKDPYDNIYLSREYFKKKFENNDNINLYIYIKRSQASIKNNKECQYSIVKTSSTSNNTAEELLQPGEVKTRTIQKGESHHFIIEDVKKRKGAVISVGFKHGTAKLYVKIPKVPLVENIRFPTLGDCDYEGESIFSGKIVEIPEEIFNRLNSVNIKLQILVTIEAESADGDIKSGSEMSYTISYSDEPKSISQNVPYEGYIQKGESQYFKFYFDESVENIYIGLSNMDGDVDMYLNYGTYLPTPNKFDWSSDEIDHEFFDLNIKDKFYKANGYDSISGYYTLLLLGFTDSSFTLFISTHKETVMPLENNRPVTCKCDEDDKCYLRYNSVYHSENKKKGIEHNEIVFTTQYLYGNGIMYAKVFKDYELNNNDFYKNFPNETNYDISNKESNQRNYMKYTIQGGQYTKDSSILLTFVCLDNTQVDITATTLRHYNTIDYILPNRENVFYLGHNEYEDKNSEIELHFFNFNDNKDLIYSIHSYVGDAHFEVLSTNFRWNEEKEAPDSTTTKFNEFDILSSNIQEKDNIEVYNPYSKDYHNFIPSQKLQRFQEIIFKVTPKNEFGFYIQCSYDKDWNNIPIGKSKKFNAIHQTFFGYFDIVEEYSDIELSLSIENNLETRADIFVKINVVDKKKKAVIKDSDNISEFSLYRYSYPSAKNYDYAFQSDEVLGTISLNINNLPILTKEDKENKFVRALVLVRLSNINFQPLLPFDEDNDFSRGFHRHHHHHNNWERDDNANEFTLLLTPGENYVKYVDANPGEYYLSNLTYKSGVELIPESKTYSININNKKDQILIIEISSCYGYYKMHLTDKINTISDKIIKEIKYVEKRINGKHIIYVHDLKSKHYYLTITAKESDFLCKLKQRLQGERNVTLNKCGNDLTYTMRYYTVESERFILKDLISKMVFHRPYGNGKIEIDLPKIVLRNTEYYKNYTIDNYKFDVFATQNEDYYENMGSVCYLANYNLSHGNVKKLDNVKRTKNSLILSDLGYRKKYYINILIQNVDDKELIALTPFVVWTGGFLPFPLWQTGTANLIIIILIVILVIVIRKYCAAKTELKEIKGETLPKTEIEMGISNRNTENIKYSGLGESY